MASTVIGLAAPSPGSAPTPTREKTPSGRYRLSVGTHPLDGIFTCPSCREVTSQRYDATVVVPHAGRIADARQYTCGACKQTHFRDVVLRPDLTEKDVLTVLDRRQLNAIELRTRIAIADMWAENARCRGQYGEASERAREALELRRQLFKIERLCGTEAE